MQYYKKINIDYYDIILEKITMYLESKGLIDNVCTGFISINYIEVIKNCPELQVSLDAIGLRIKSIGIYRTTRNSQAPIHIDHTIYLSLIHI